MHDTVNIQKTLTIIICIKPVGPLIKYVGTQLVHRKGGTLSTHSGAVSGYQETDLILKEPGMSPTAP